MTQGLNVSGLLLEHVFELLQFAGPAGVGLSGSCITVAGLLLAAATTALALAAAFGVAGFGWLVVAFATGESLLNFEGTVHEGLAIVLFDESIGFFVGGDGNEGKTTTFACFPVFDHFGGCGFACFNKEINQGLFFDDVFGRLPTYKRTDIGNLLDVGWVR